MKVLQIVKALEAYAPPHLAAEWDNVGLLIGDPTANAASALLCIDATESVLAEALTAKASIIVAYHPVIFKPLARLTPGDAGVAFTAARKGLAVYSLHTAMDAVPGGTNDVLADTLGMEDRQPLEPSARRDQCKVVTFVPPADLSRVADAAFAAGAGRIGNYFDCAFFGHGIGSFCGAAGTHPTIGQSGRHEAVEELRLEIIAPRSKAPTVCSAIRAAHSYETAPVDVYPIDDYPGDTGMGRIGTLRRPVTLRALLGRIKKATGIQHLQVARARNTDPSAPLRTVACCAGSCGPAFRSAVRAGAGLYLTGEMRHHDALAAAGSGMHVVCLGHSHSERMALRRVQDVLHEALPELKVTMSKQDRDPFEIV